MSQCVACSAHSRKIIAHLKALERQLKHVVNAGYSRLELAEWMLNVVPNHAFEAVRTWRKEDSQSLQAWFSCEVLCIKTNKVVVRFWDGFECVVEKSCVRISSVPCKSGLDQGNTTKLDRCSQTNISSTSEAYLIAAELKLAESAVRSLRESGTTVIEFMRKTIASDTAWLKGRNLLENDSTTRAERMKHEVVRRVRADFVLSRVDPSTVREWFTKRSEAAVHVDLLKSFILSFVLHGGEMPMDIIKHSIDSFFTQERYTYFEAFELLRLGGPPRSSIRKVQHALSSSKKKKLEATIGVELETVAMTSRLNRPKPERDVATLKEDIDSENKHILNAIKNAKTIERYSRLLSRAIAIGAAGANLEHQGFQAIEQLIDSGGDCLPGCAICLGALKAPVCTECVHLFCSDCLKNHSLAMPLISWGFNSEERFPCPLCRSMLRRADIIQIVPQENKTNDCNTDIENLRLFKGNSADDGVPSWFPALSKPEINQIAAEAMRSLSYRRLRVNQFAGVEALDSRLVRLLGSIISKPKLKSTDFTSHRSSKIQRILNDVTSIIESSKDKIILFSQFRSVVLHLSRILDADLIEHRKIVKGDKEPALEQAVHDFNQQTNTRVLLLHSSETTAGLTLTSANHVMFVEPFLERNSKLQAINRAHRMGQTGQVEVRTYFVQGTVEERLLAYTYWQGQSVADTDGMAALPVSADASEADKGSFLRYVSGVSEQKD